MRPLYQHQETALAMILEAARSGAKRIVVQLPTGAGKTRLAAELIKRAQVKGNPVLFVVPALSLIDQTVASFATDGITDVGVIQAEHPLTDPTRPVQIASIQSLIRRTKPDVKVIIVDECHVLFRAFLEWLASEEMKGVIVIGLSATPWTKGLGKHYNNLIVCATTKQMIEDGRLSPFRVFAPAHPDLSGVATVGGDYQKGQLEEAMNKPLLVADIVSTWLRMGEGRPTLAFGVDRAHAKSIQARFEEAGVPCGYVDAYTSPEERIAVRDKFHHGEYRVVSNVSCLTTGTDWDVRCIIDARPTKSEILITQIYGRGLRTADGKDDLIILDHADNYTRHGFVTDIHHEKLDDGTPKASQKRKAVLPKECPECAFLRPPKISKCPNCGYQPDGMVVSDVESAEGSLSEVVRGKGTKATGPRNHVRIGGVWIPLDEFYGMLRWHGRAMRHKEGWAAHQYRDAVGTWPNRYPDAPDRQPTWEVKSWLKANLIRRVKRFEKEKKQAGGSAHAGP